MSAACHGSESNDDLAVWIPSTRFSCDVDQSRLRRRERLLSKRMHAEAVDAPLDLLIVIVSELEF